MAPGARLRAFRRLKSFHFHCQAQDLLQIALDAEPERWHSAAAGRASARLDHLQNEILLLAEMDHPGVMRMVDYYEDVDCVHIVTEKYTSGGLGGGVSEVNSIV